MPLTLITGPANSAKAKVVLDEYRGRLGQAPILVVPTAADVEHYQRELALGGAVIGARVMGFSGLIGEVARAGGYEARLIGPLGRQRLVAHVIGRAKLETLAASARSPGFLAAAGELIAELERELVEPARLTAALRAWAGEDDWRRRYGEELAAIYGQYRDALGRIERVDEELFAWRALDALRRAPGAWGARPVSFYGFDDFTRTQLDAVETLARVVGTEVTVSLPYEPGRHALAGRAATFEWLRPLAQRHEQLPAQAEHYAPSSRRALHHLERALFEDDPAAVPAGDAVRLLAAGGERAESELVAAEVLGLLRAGTPPEQIAVVFRELPAASAALIEQVFGAYGVPLALRRTVPFGHTALGRGLLGLARCAPEGGGTAADLLAYLRTPGKLDRLELADALEAHVRQRGVQSAAEARGLWESERWPLGELERLARAVEGGTASFAEALERELKALFARPRRGLGAVLGAHEAQDARAFAAARAALGELRQLASATPWLAPAPIELPELLAALAVWLGEPPGPGRVQIARPLEIRARRYRAVFLCGLQDGEFPARARPDPLLSDERRRELARASGLVLRPRAGGLGEERYLFYACTSRPEELLALSFRTADEEGDPAPPSPFLDDAAELFEGGLQALARRTRTLGDVSWPPEQAPTRREHERALVVAGPRVAPEPIASLRSPTALAALGVGGRLSAGALETYAGCPVRWLVERRLRPEALEPEAEHLSRGRLAHAVLARTLVALAEQCGSARITGGRLETAERILRAALGELAREVRISPDQTRSQAALLRLQGDLLRYLRHEAASDSELEPAHFELRFGFDDGASDRSCSTAQRSSCAV